MGKEKKINIESAEDEELNKTSEDEANVENNKETDKKSAEEDTVAEEADNKDENAKQEEEKDPLAQAQEEIAALKDKYIRQIAEFDNFRKRTLKEKSELIFNGGEKAFKSILPILDDFERALSDKTEDAQAIKEGFELIYKKFVSTLESQGVKAIETEDKDFDTDQMEAIALVPGMGDEKKGKVIDCVSKGYTLNDKVLRHAKVAVGQ